MMERNTVSDLELEKYVLQELGASKTAEIDRLRSEDPAMEKRISSIEASDREILDAYPPRAWAARITEAAERSPADAQRRPLWKTAIPALGAAAAAAVLTLVLLPAHAPVEVPGTAPAGGDNLEAVRIKGHNEPSLYVFRKSSNGGEERLKSGQSASPGDVIQLKYAAKGAPYGIIFSIDGRGTLTLHHPGSGELPAAIESRGTHALDFSYELDDAPSYERFFFVTSQEPIDAETVMEQARNADPGMDGTLSLDPAQSQCDFVLKKTR